jgi:hypothetical protein
MEKMMTAEEIVRALAATDLWARGKHPLACPFCHTTRRIWPDRESVDKIDPHLDDCPLGMAMKWVAAEQSQVLSPEKEKEIIELIRKMQSGEEPVFVEGLTE